MKFRNLSIIFFLSILSLPAMSSADLKPAYFFANGNGRDWAIEEGQRKTPDIAIDEDGQVWVICNGQVYRANPEVLKEVNYLEEGMYPVQFAKSPKGQLYILWRSLNSKLITVTSLSQGKIKRVTSLKLQERIGLWRDLFFYIDSLERFWITGGFPGIYFWEKGEWKHHKINRKEFFHRVRRNKEWIFANVSPEEWEKGSWVSGNLDSICCTEVSNGKMVFWSSGAIFLNPLSFSNGKFENFQHMFSMPRDVIRVGTVKVFTDGVFWVAVDPYGEKAGPNVFEVNLARQKVRPVPSMDTNLRVLRIISGKERGTFFLVCKYKKSKNISLWKIKKNELRLEIKPGDRWGFADRKAPLLISKKGHIWLAAGISGIWIKLKNSDYWEKLDGRSGFPFIEINNIKEDQYGNIWACGHYSHGNGINGLYCLTSPNRKESKKCFKATPALNWVGIPLDVKLNSSSRPFMFDKDSNLWAMLNRTTFGRFDTDKKKWIRFSLRESFRYPELAYDDRGCIWIFGDSYEGNKVAVFKEGIFNYFPSLKSACESIAKDVKRCNVFQRGHVYPCNWYGYDTYISIKDGKVCFLQRHDNSRIVNYFDSANWKHWKLSEIMSNAACYSENSPFFDKKGNLRINLEEKSWLWSGTRWKATAYLEGPSEKKRQLESLKDKQRNALMKKLNKLGKFSGDRIEEVIEADDGTIWARTRFSLYKLVGDICIELDEGKHPLIGGGRLTNVDKGGNLYVRASESLFVRLADYPPETTIVEKSAVIDKLPICFSFSGRDDKTPEDKLRFSWSLDEEKWSVPSYDRTISFERLSNGEHALKVKALDEELNYDLTPAVVRFTVKVDAKNLLAENLEMLKSSDYKEREKAIRNLVHIGREALPELKKLREESKDDDLHWWIDVVIQQIEQNVTSKERCRKQTLD